MLKKVKSVTKSVVKSAARGVRNDPEVRKIVAKYPRTFHFIKKRLTPDEKFGLYLTVGIVISGMFIYLFLEILLGLFTRDLLVMSDLRVLNIAASYRTPKLNQLMYLITTLGSGGVIFAGTGALATYFYLNNRWRHSVSIVASVIFGEFFYRLLKYAVERSRPPLSLSLIYANGYSFPSGHAFMATVFYGLVGYFVYRRTKTKLAKITVLVLFSFLIGIIGYSRIYLGVHWPTDVLAGFASGAAWITVFVTVLEIGRKFRNSRLVSHVSRPLVIPSEAQRVEKSLKHSKIDPSATLGMTNTREGKFKKLRDLGFILFAAWLVFLGFFWRREADTAFIKGGYSRERKISITEQDFPGKLFEGFPRFSETISGKPQEPIHIIIIGSEDQLKSSFIKAGWLECDRLNTKNIKRQAIASLLNEPYPTGPGVPSLWNTVPNNLSFEKPTELNSARERHHIHFWETPFLLNDSRPSTVLVPGRQVWFATAHYDMTVNMKAAIMPVHTIDPAIDKERERIKAELSNTGEIESVSEFQVVEPTLGKNQSGDLFFTDGKAYVFYLK